MPDNHDLREQASDLRRRAELKALENEAVSPGNSATRTPEKTQQILHELSVHQIELELQNEELRSTQVELDNALAQYFDLYDLSPAGSCTLDEKGMILKANLTAATFLGVDRGTLLRQPISRYILDADKDKFYLHRKWLIETGGQETFELRMLKKDGTSFWTRWEASVTEDVSGEKTCYIVLIDINASKLYEEKLKESENKFRNLVWNMQIGVLLQGPRAEIVLCNPKALELLGITEDQLLGKTSLDPDWDVIHEDGSPFPGSAHPVPQAIATRHPVRGVVMGVYRPSTGDRVWLLADAEPHLNDDGKVLQVACYFIDITDRMRVLAALRESEDKFKYVFDYSVIGKSITLPSGEMQVNRAFCEILGYSQEELAARTWQEVTHPDDIESSRKIVDSLLKDGKETVRFTKRYIHKSGTTVWADVSTALRRDLDGKPLYFITSVSDVTERKHTEEELRKSKSELELFNTQLETKVAERTAELEASNKELEASNKELEAFAHSISHDLRAPLRAMEGFSDNLLQAKRDSLDIESVHRLERIQTASRRMGMLINDLLNLSRVTRCGFHTSMVDISLLASRILARLGNSNPTRKVEPVIKPGMTTKGDKDLISILLEHLLDNAWKFTAIRSPAIIHAGWKTIRDQTAFYIQDNGIGFDMAYTKNMFTPFIKLHGMESGTGTGIGLAIASKIVARHGGRIWAESEPDRGAVFYFTLKPNESDPELPGV